MTAVMAGAPRSGEPYGAPRARLGRTNPFPVNVRKVAAELWSALVIGHHVKDRLCFSRGGLIEVDIVRALIAVTARDGTRKVLISFTPGKSILSNAPSLAPVPIR